jgi:hypothetical protein
MVAYTLTAYGRPCIRRAIENPKARDRRVGRVTPTEKAWMAVSSTAMTGWRLADGVQFQGDFEVIWVICFFTPAMLVAMISRLSLS